MNVSKEELKEILNEQDLVVVDFWASWCGPCRVMAPIFNKFAENNGDANIYKVQVDLPENDGAGQDFGLKSIPAFLYFKGGVEVERLMGRQTLETLQEKFDAHV